jgi:TonB family protein
VAQADGVMVVARLLLTSGPIRAKLRIFMEGQGPRAPGPNLTRHRMPQPDTYGPPASRDKESSGHVGDVVSSEDPRDVAEIARTLAAHGGGSASFDLALDLVLNEVVEQARLATGATGAAVALARGGELVCRATTGADAPELGTRLETTSGLSGACLQSGTMQECADTETDLRVNAEACRRLGVRSILVFPLGDGKNPLGVFEIFSSRPNAFGERDVNTLRVLARRLEENARQAKQAESDLTKADDESSGLATKPTSSASDESPAEENATRLIAGAAPKPTERWAPVLSVLVIALAMLLGLTLGWRAGIGRRSGSDRPAGIGTSSTPIANTATASAGEPKTVAPVRELASSAGHGSVSQNKMSGGASSGEPPTGGLQVTQNGKVIYRLAPPEQRTAAGTGSTTAGTGATTEGSTAGGTGDASRTRLIRRVEPEYPVEARTRHIQGSVILDVQIGSDGAVRNITVVNGDPVLGDAAVAAVRQWRYLPSSVAGRPVEMQTRITIRFTLPPP